jgi:hypothetical protein
MLSPSELMQQVQFVCLLEELPELTFWNCAGQPVIVLNSKHILEMTPL